MRGIKIPQQYFALKMQGGLMRGGGGGGGGGVFAGHYGIYIGCCRTDGCIIPIVIFDS